jgi:hypothetical protein
MSEYKYPIPTCQDCGRTCKVSEEVNVGKSVTDGVSKIELWCYCDKCDLETNHGIKSDNKHYPE